MRLEMSGSHELPAPVDHVWRRLLDYRFVASCAPSVSSVERKDETSFRVVSAFGVGSLKVKFNLDVRLTELDPPHHATMSVHGKAPGSEMHVTSRVDLTAVNQSRTRLNWHAESYVHGKLTGLGARLMKGTANRLTTAFWEQFAARINDPAPAET